MRGFAQPGETAPASAVGRVYWRPRLSRALCIVPCLGLMMATTDDPVIARRGNEQITVSQAHALIGATDQSTRHRLATDQAALKAFLRDALLQRSILRLAQAEKWDRRPGVAALLQRTHDQVLAQSFIAGHAPLPADFPSDAEVRAAYDANLSRFMQPRGYHLVQIFLPSAATEDGRRLLQQARAHIQRRGLALESAAKSLPGAQFTDLGWVAETQLLPAIKGAVIGLPEGSLADTVCVDGGCHLIQLIATRPAGPAPLSAMREELVLALRQQKAAQAAAAYVSGLLANTPVEINTIQISRMAP